MSQSLYVFLSFLHLIAAVSWIGGSLFITAVLAPALRRMGDRAAAADLLQHTGKLFKRISHGSLFTLLLTGFALLPRRGIPHSRLFDAGLYAENINARLVAWKFILLLAVFGLGLWHDLSAGKRATALMRSAPDSPEAQRARRLACWIGRVSLLLTLVILALAVLLVRGSPFAG